MNDLPRVHPVFSAADMGHGSAPLCNVEKTQILFTKPICYSAANDCVHERWPALKRAFEMAGAEIISTNLKSHELYARDMFTLIGHFAFHPSVPGGCMDYAAQSFWPYLKAMGYTPFAQEVWPDKLYDGGNYIFDADKHLIIAGIDRTNYEIDFIRQPFKRNVVTMAGVSHNHHTIVNITAPHLDCCVGLLPNGQLLVKLDELEKAEEIKKKFGQDFAVKNLWGVEPTGLHFLIAQYGRENIVTYSFDNHSESDVVLGVDCMKDPIKAASLSMLTNFESVGNTIFGEDLPAPLATMLRERGVTAIGPADVGVKSFLMGDEGFVGGSRCTTLKVKPQIKDAHSYRPDIPSSRNCL